MLRERTGPARIDAVVSNILAIVTTQYREQRFGRPEKTQAFTIDRLYPFLSDLSAHDTLCSADAPNPNDLVSTVHSSDYQPRDGENRDDDIVDSAEENKNDSSEEPPLTNDLGEAAHFLPDEFCEAARPDPGQQIKLTSQGHVAFSKTWADIMEIDDRLLLNDIIPPGRHGEGWQSTTTRAALERYAREVLEYETQKLSPDVGHESELKGADKQTSHPTPGSSLFQTAPPDVAVAASGSSTSHQHEANTDDDSSDDNDADNDHNVDISLDRHHEATSIQQEKAEQTRAPREDGGGNQDRAQEGDV